jgi:hypothetical protein
VIKINYTKEMDKEMIAPKRRSKIVEPIKELK